MEPGVEPDRAILWKMARKRKIDEEVEEVKEVDEVEEVKEVDEVDEVSEVDDEFAVVCKKIVSFLNYICILASRAINYN